MKIIWPLFFSLLLMLSPAFADNNGEIYHLTYSPEEPVALEDLTLSIGVENPSNVSRGYLLQVQIIKEGKIISDEEFTFNLDKEKGLFLTPKFTPQDIGEHEIVVKLYDKVKFELFDTSLLNFNSVSTLGPFDIIVEPLTSRVRPGLLLPTKVILENMGIKGSDIEIQVSVNCPDKVLTQSLTIFMPAEEHSERLLSLQTCDQEGLYTVQASIIVFNRTWVSSISQFFVNSSFIHLTVDAPEKITLKPGESFSFPVEVTNVGNQKITDLKFVIQRIPLEWQKSTPSSILEVSPNQKVVFVANITIPTDAEPKIYEIRMTAAAEEVLERQISTLEVTPLAVLTPIVDSNAFNIIKYVLISLSVPALIFVLIKIRQRVKDRSTYKQNTMIKSRVDMLEKIREKIKSKR